MYGGVVIVIQLYGLFQYSINDRQFWKTHEETQASLGELPSVLRRFDRGTLVASQWRSETDLEFFGNSAGLPTRFGQKLAAKTY